MKREAETFLCALMMLTRIPVGAHIHHDQHNAKNSPKYYSWIGIMIGMMNASLLVITAQIFPTHLSVLLSMLGIIWVTGALHEDGFADVCDGFGGGWTKEKILTIMKDSRLGTFGVTGLVGMLSFRFLLLVELSATRSTAFIFAVIVAGHAISRFAAVTMIQQYNYVSGTGGKSSGIAESKLTAGGMAVAAAGASMPLLFLPVVYSMPLLMVGVARVLLGRYCKRWIGGYTGDCLGAMQQVAEVVFYAGVYMLWKFIS